MEYIIVQRISTVDSSFIRHGLRDTATLWRSVPLAVGFLSGSGVSEVPEIHRQSNQFLINVCVPDRRSDFICEFRLAVYFKFLNRITPIFINDLRIRLNDSRRAVSQHLR